MALQSRLRQIPLQFLINWGLSKNQVIIPKWSGLDWFPPHFGHWTTIRLDSRCFQVTEKVRTITLNVSNDDRVSRHGDVTLMSDNWHRIHHQVCWIITTPYQLQYLSGFCLVRGNQFGTKCMQLRSFLTFAKQLNQCQGLCFWNSLYNFIYSNSQKRIGRYFQDSLLLMYFSYFQLSSPFLSLTLGIAIWQCVKTLDPWWTSK